MKYRDIRPANYCCLGKSAMTLNEDDSPFRPLEGGTFRFRCHRGIECFTRCCADLKLVLTPYDILRIKRRLGIPSSEFLEQYSETVIDSRKRFPTVILRMRKDDKRTCPFVTEEGCSIYDDRPGACRIYPLGRATRRGMDGKGAAEKFFVVQEKHCLGFRESREWTVEEWICNEGLEEYNAMNDLWLDIITSTKSLGPEEGIPRKIQMFFMACYNLDRFREFLFKSRFFERFEVSPDIKGPLASDDTALMRFAFDWLRFSLFGEKTIQPSRR